MLRDYSDQAETHSRIALADMIRRRPGRHVLELGQFPSRMIRPVARITRLEEPELVAAELVQQSGQRSCACGLTEATTPRSAGHPDHRHLRPLGPGRVYGALGRCSTGKSSAERVTEIL